MNSMERVLATLAGEPLDRRAFAPVLGLYGARLTDCPLDRYYTDPVAYARGQRAVLETFRPDVLCAPLAFASVGAAFGGQLAFLETQAPNLRRPAISSIEDWEQVAPPDPDADPWLTYLADAIRLMVADHGRQVPIAMVIPIPADIPALIMGLGTWLEAVLFEPDRAERVMDALIPFYVGLVNGFFAAGATFVVMPAGLVSATIVTHEIAATFTQPILARALAQLDGPVILHGVGAPMLPHLDVLTGLPSVVGFIVDELDDLDQVRRVVGPDAVVFGGLDCASVSMLTATEVELRCRAVLEGRREDPRFVLGTSGPDVVWDTPPENIHAMRRAVEAAGARDG